MKKVVMVVSVIAFAANTNAENIQKTDSEGLPKVKNIQKISAEDLKKSAQPNPSSGSYIGLGLYAGRQRTLCPINEDFLGVKTKVNSTVFGGNVIAGFDQKIFGNFSIGIEAGIDFGSKGKKHAIGRILSQDSAKFKAIASYVNMIFTNAGSAFAQLVGLGMGAGAAVEVIDQAGYSNFVRTLNYIGGSAQEPDWDFVNGDEAGGLYDTDNDTVMRNVKLADFVAWNNEGNPLAHLGSNNRESVIIAREFITTYCPELATYLKNMTDFAADLTSDDVLAISDFLLGRDIDGYDIGNDLHMEGDIAVLEQLRKNLNQYTHNVKETTTNGSADFGISPRLLLRGSYYMPDADATVAVKAGAILVNGTARFSNEIGNKNFKKVAPMIELAVEKQINDELGVSVGVSHVFQTTKKFSSMNLLGTQINPKVKIRKTTFGVTFTYRIK